MASIPARMVPILEGFSDQTYHYGKGPKYSVPKLILWAEQHGKLEIIPIQKLLHNLETMHADEPIGSASFIKRARQTKMMPLLVLRARDGRLHIADGLHRLWRAKEEKLAKIRAYVIPMDNLPRSALA